MGASRVGREESYRGGIGETEEVWGIKQRMRTDHLALALVRKIIACEVAGAWDRFGGSGLQLQNVAAVMEISVRTNQGVASKLRAEQSRELQLLARGRHDPKPIKNHLLQPDPASLTRVIEDQN